MRNPANLVILVSVITCETVNETSGALDDPRTEDLEDRGREIRQKPPDRINGLIRRQRMTDDLGAVDGECRVAQVAELFRLLQRRHFMV